MCDPISMLGFGLSAAGAFAGYEAQSEQASAQTKMYQQNALNAERAFANTNTALGNQEMQQQAADSQKRQENDLATRAAQASAIAGGAAGGVQGISLQELVNSYTARDARANAAINTQEQWGIAQAQSEKAAAGDQQVGRINSMTPGIQPSMLNTGLQIGQAAVSGITGAMRNSYYGTGGMPFMGSFGSSLAMGGFN